MVDLNNFNQLKTPNLNHIKSSDWLHVYEPAEDTFLLLDALENDLKLIEKKKPSVCLEIGSGSGVIITALSKKLGSETHCLAIDINQYACGLTSSTATNNSARVDVIQGDLTTCLKDFLIDMIIFNPPYVVTPSEEVTGSDLLAKSWAGGADGREVIDRFLKLVNNSLSRESFGYILLLKENKPSEVIGMLKKIDFNCEIVKYRKIRGEELFVVRFER